MRIQRNVNLNVYCVITKIYTKEYRVTLWVNNVFQKNSTYFSEDKNDAISSGYAMIDFEINKLNTISTSADK